MRVLAAPEVQKILDGGLGRWSDLALEGCKIVSCSPKRLVVSLPVTERITNSGRNLHGGASSTLIDVLSEPRASPADSLRCSPLFACLCRGSYRRSPHRRPAPLRHHRPAHHMRLGRATGLDA